MDHEYGRTGVAVLYMLCEPLVVRREVRLETENTPRHGSWLNVAEIEQSSKYSIQDFSNSA